MRYRPHPVGKSLPRQAILALMLSLLLVANAFADREQALAAQASGDYTNAVKLWLQLANDGDPLAQYNLALLYQRGAGVNPDANLSKYWFSMAGRQGLVGAYARTNAQNVQPMALASVPSSMATAPNSENMGPQEWVAAQNPNYYTLQLASSTNQALIEKYYSENELTGKAGYYRSRRAGEDWYALVYGAYPTVQDAKDAIDNLPVDLKKWSPWVRNIKSIHKIMVH